MRRRLPSPALVIASLALFVALAGAGVAAGLALVRSPKPIMLVSGSVGADGKVTGAGLTGGRQSEGVYVITIRGDTFAPPAGAASRHLRDKVEAVLRGANGAAPNPPQCLIAGDNLASNGGATAEIDCFTLDPAAGWQPADAAFDFEMIGPSR